MRRGAGEVVVSIDVGSTAIKAVAREEIGGALTLLCRPVRGRLHACLESLLHALADDLGTESLSITAVTGSGGHRFAQAFQVAEVNEIIAAYRGSAHLVSQAGAALELGGEHSKFIRFDRMVDETCPQLKDFQINTVCSAGTGAFLEQEAHRLDLTIEQFAEQAASARRATRIAGRCAVFAKTDIVHAHQNGVPLDGVAYTLCYAIARNIASQLIGGREFERPLALVGGVAANAGMRRALREVLGLDEPALIVPEQHAFVDALGALLATQEGKRGRGCTLAEALRRLRDMPNEVPQAAAALPPLRISDRSERRTRPPAARRSGDSNGAGPEYTIGIDIGSTTTNVALVSVGGDVLDQVTQPTRGRAVVAVRGCLERLQSRRAALDPKAVGVTGSGRRFVAELIGANLAINEITAHAIGGAHFYPAVETIVDIGGQDSKFIQLSDGSVTGFEMNKVCSAGTGSFIEEMSGLLGLDIVDEFASEALASDAPLDLGERCTVFMSSELMRRLREGARREDLAAGLCYSIVHNYLSRVVGRRRIGDRILFQGGVAANAAVVAAFEQVTGKRIRVHEHNHVAGALGAALLARDRTSCAPKFRGLEALDESGLTAKWFECRRCANQCAIHVTTAAGGRRFFSGGLCDRYEGLSEGECSEGSDRELDLFAEREEALNRWVVADHDSDRALLGVPRALIFHEMLPLWSAFLAELGVNHAFSEPTTKETISRGSAFAHANTCLPLKIAYGHCAELIDRGVDRVFAPSIATLCFRTQAERLDHLCPTVQGWPYTARALFDGKVEWLSPRLRFSIPRLIEADMVRLGRSLGAGRRRTMNAFERGIEAQRSFLGGMLERGKDVLDSREEGRMYAALLARSYTACEPQIYMRLKRVLDDLDITAIPMDMLADEPLDSDSLNGMYWYFGKRMLQVARSLNRDRELPVILLSNFGCGPDSFIVHMLRRELSDVRVLELEVDEHSEFTGIHTRLEAFKYSAGRGRSLPVVRGTRPRHVAPGTLARRQLLIPQMSGHAFAFSGAFRACGVDARVMPLPDQESLTLGKLALGGNECLPCAFVMGDMLRSLEDRSEHAPPPAFFMISGDGPCRLGQYPWLQRTVLNERGFSEVPIFDAPQDPEFYAQIGRVGGSFRRFAWRGTVAADLIFQKWRECRARARDRSAADAIHDESIARLERRLEARQGITDLLSTAFDRFDRLPRRSQPPAVTVAILGENYIRCNLVANNHVAELLEGLGADVWFPSLCEWVYYTNWTARLHCRYERQYRRLLQLIAVDAWQRAEERRLERAVRGRLRNARRPTVWQLIRLAAPYVPSTFEGETIVGVGRTLDLHRRGVGGVIHVAPFGCMVGAIVDALCERISDDLGGFPILNLQYDGHNSDLAQGKLEGFLHRARSWQARPNNNAHPGLH